MSTQGYRLKDVCTNLVESGTDCMFFVLVNLTPADIAQWPKPNYENPERKTWLPAYAVVLWTVGSLVVATRFWLRFKGQAGRLGLDDVRAA